MFAVLFITLIWLVCSYLFLVLRRPLNYPPGPQWYPIVGNLLQLRREIRKHGSPYRVYKYWMEKYNSPVIGIKLGDQYTVIALSYPVLNEVFKRSEFEGRPDNLIFRLRIGVESGERIGITSADGESWWEQRNFVARHLKRLGLGHQLMEQQIHEELEEMLKIFDKNEGKPIWPGEHLPISVLNVLWIFMAGKKISRSEGRIVRILELLRGRDKALNLSGGFLNTMPFLRHIAPEWIHYNSVKKFNSEIRQFMQVVIDEHKESYSDDKVDDDLIYSYLYEMKIAKDSQSNFTDDQLIAVVLDLFIAGAVTTSSTLNFILIALAIHPEIQKRCHDVIDEVLGDTAYPQLSNKSRLSYIEAVILETERIRNVIEVIGPRRALKSTTLGGYYIPKNTTILMATQHVMKDEEHWIDPDVYRPERFLDENQKIRNTERMLVFGKGMRRCIGEVLARACLFTYLTGILQKYRIELPENSTLSLDHCEFGFTTMPKHYEIIFKRR